MIFKDMPIRFTLLLAVINPAGWANVLGEVDRSEPAGVGIAPPAVAVEVREVAPAEPNQMDLLEDSRPLAVGDRLLYSVVEERSLPVALFVNALGEVDVPLIGRVSAKGQTCRTLAMEIQKRLEVDFFHRATVLLQNQFAENTRGKVNVAGAVQYQGAYPIPADQIFTVSAAILRAGGLLPGADATKVVLIRRSGEGDGQEVRLTIDVAKIFASGDFENDLPVQAEDLVVVPRNEQTGGQVYILGAVNNPGLFNVPGGGSLTVSKAILLAGGLNRFARSREVKLIRPDPAQPEHTITRTIDVAEILEKGNRAADVEVQPNDIIRVEERMFAF